MISPSAMAAAIACGREPHPGDWAPNVGPQSRFLSLTCFEGLYGGQAGGGKSDALLVDAIRYINHCYGPAYHALALRRTFTELESSLIKRSFDLYPQLGGRYNEQKKTWRFRGGERVQFGHCENEKDVHQYQGSAFQRVLFDELTSFTFYQYTYLFSRVRSAVGVPCGVRGATNPGGVGHEWVVDRFGMWLRVGDPDYRGRVAGPGEVVYFARNADDSERVVSKGERGAQGRTFVPARLEDNPHLALNDPEYVRRLDELDPVTRERLKQGNWLVRPGKGMYFKADWLPIVDDIDPVDGPVVLRVRYWDRAATQGGGDFTAGARWARTQNGVFYVEDMKRAQLAPGGVQDLIEQTAIEDGDDVHIVLEQDPGAAGKFEAAHYVAKFAGRTIRTVSKRVNKVTAAGPASAQAQHGRIKLRRGPWNREFVREHVEFPEGKHDDQVDTSGGAVNYLTLGYRGDVPEPPQVEDESRFEDTARGF